MDNRQPPESDDQKPLLEGSQEPPVSSIPELLEQLQDRFKNLPNLFIAWLSRALHELYQAQFASFLKGLEDAQRRIESLESTVAQLTDVAEQQIIEREKVERRLHLDLVTSLPNWEGYRQRAVGCIRQEQEAKYMSVVVLDMVGFGKVDNTFGLMQGNLILKIVGKCLSLVIRDRRTPKPVVLGYDHSTLRSVELTDMVARFGGDEFVDLLLETEPQGELAALRCKEKIRSIDWYTGPEVMDVPELESGVRSYLAEHPLDFRSGVVDYELPTNDRPSEPLAIAQVDWLFNRADALMRMGKDDPENPVLSVIVAWRTGLMQDLTAVKRAVL